MFRNQRVLIVDDSRTPTELLETILSPHRKEVLVAASVEEAIAQLEGASQAG
jgi:CheY-like chemotaxis protein